MSRKDCTDTAKLALTKGFIISIPLSRIKTRNTWGSALRGVPRSQLYITTKLMKFDWAGRADRRGDVGESLKKLQTDFVDLFPDSRTDGPY